MCRYPHTSPSHQSTEATSTICSLKLIWIIIGIYILVYSQNYIWSYVWPWMATGYGRWYGCFALQWLYGCRWVKTIKVGCDGKIDHLKACLVEKEYTQYPWLWRYLLSSCQDRLYPPSSCFSLYSSMAAPSTSHQKCLPTWWVTEGGVHGVTTRVKC